MQKSFKFLAPLEYLSTSKEQTKEVTSTYKGAETIWIYVDKDTGKNPQFVSEGDLPDPTDTETRRSVLLDANNENHILLMDILANSRGHTHEDGWVTEYLNEEGDIPDNPTYRFEYTTYATHDAVHTYDYNSIIVDENNVVSCLEFCNPPSTDWNPAKIRLESDIVAFTERLNDPMIASFPEVKSKFQQYISLLKFILDNFVDKVPIWKVTIPLYHDFLNQ